MSGFEQRLHRSDWAAWLDKHGWLLMELITRDDGSWGAEALSPSGALIEFSGDRDHVLYWAIMPARVEVVNDGEDPVVVQKASDRC